MTLREVDCGDVIALENFFQELKTESLPPTWKYSHIGLVRRLEGLDKNPKTTTSTIDIEKLDRIFSKKDKDSEHMRDVCIREVQFDVLLNKLGEEDRSVIVKSAEVITRTIEQFCLDISEEARPQRMHACNFITQCLHDNPPNTDESRNFWLDVIIEDTWPIEFKMLVLNVLEHDYAGLLQKINGESRNGNSHGCRIPRTLKSKDQNLLLTFDPTTTPLAYSLMISDKSNVVEALAKKYRASTDVDSRKLFAGLIGLLLDIFLWQHWKDSIYHECDHNIFLNSIPEHIMTEYKRARKIIGTSPDSHHIRSKVDKAELQAFGNAVRVPWISTLIYKDIH
ncbi:hypothetical protein DdX_03325 [Ditylenchus destructor]|uniref:Uncharacterized protein n=1 Tax=Ditylenchus destructor TaxID=166010 RepID=A0AAD4RCV5_9BILA|nr:hypothetical protein DdX_03325 [Ditylenchus destructor]